MYEIYNISTVLVIVLLHLARYSFTKVIFENLKYLACI